LLVLISASRRFVTCSIFRVRQYNDLMQFPTE
jgi:hypothetical protein